jgi:hypothetical protein
MSFSMVIIFSLFLVLYHMLLQLKYILVILALQLLTVLYYNTHICLPDIAEPLHSTLALQRGSRRTFLELDDYIRQIGAPPRVGRGKTTRTTRENNICIVINEVEGITRTGGISASYLVSLLIGAHTPAGLSLIS